CELLLLFAALASAGALVWLRLAVSARPSAHVAAAASAAAVAALVIVVSARSGNGFLVIPVNTVHWNLALSAHDRCGTQDRLELTAWIDEHIPADAGDVAVAAYTTPEMYTGEVDHIFAVNGGQAPLLYGRGYRCRFGVPTTEPRETARDYDAKVRDSFDPDWCRERGVRYFYIDAVGFRANPGLARAVEKGLLKPVHRVGGSGVYEVVVPA